MPEISVVNLESLANSSMYVSINFTRFGNSRKAKVEMTDPEYGNPDRYSHSKRLLNSPELAAIAKADTGIKIMVDALCLPSKHEMAGLRMAPNKNVIKIAAILKEYKTVTRPELIAAFIAVYPTQRAESQIELKEHFNAAHFPTVEELTTEFSFSYAFVNLGVPQAMADLSPELFEEQVAQQQETFKDAVNEVSNTLLATFAEMVTKLNNGLNGKNADGQKKLLLPSHFEKLTEFINGFEAMSSFAPAVLKAEVTKMQALMSGVDIDKVKNSENLKAELSAKTGEIVNTMIASGDLKGRFFRKPAPKPQVCELPADVLATPYGQASAKFDVKEQNPALPGESDMLAAMLKSAESNVGAEIAFEIAPEKGQE